MQEGGNLTFLPLPHQPFEGLATLAVVTRESTVTWCKQLRVYTVARFVVKFLFLNSSFFPTVSVENFEEFCGVAPVATFWTCGKFTDLVESMGGGAALGNRAKTGRVQKSGKSSLYIPLYYTRNCLVIVLRFGRKSEWNSMLKLNYVTFLTCLPRSFRFALFISKQTFISF